MKKLILITSILTALTSSILCENIDTIDSTTNLQPKYKEHTVTKSTTNSSLFDNTTCLVSKKAGAISDKITEMRHKQIGVSIVSTSGFMAVDIEHINDLLSKEKNIPGSIVYGQNVRIPSGSTEYSTMFYSGGSLIFGTGNGFRFGFSGNGVYRNYSTTSGNDMFDISIASGYGGLLLEKGFVSEKNNFSIGLLVGAGGEMVGINRFENVVSTSAFSSDNENIFYYNQNHHHNFDYEDYDEDDFIDNFENYAKGSFAVTELNVGYSYSILCWLHIGADAKIAVRKSISIENDLGDYTTFNPSLGFRLVFGTLG